MSSQLSGCTWHLLKLQIRIWVNLIIATSYQSLPEEDARSHHIHVDILL